MVHAASLVLDDLPCMDGAATRRGRPTCHVLFGEATAILAGFGLLNRAFAVLAGDGAPGATRDRLRALLARRLAAAIGTDGLIGGQTADLEAARGGGAAGHPPDLRTLEFIHSHKTGSLFIASAEVGAHLSGATPREVDALASYARNLGLAFQITDDLIDAVGEERAAGKPVRSDARRTTFVTLCGVEGARALATELTATAVSCLAPFGRRARRLEELARLLEVRDR
jgi:geranylgeranyl pyrophosphate synthase